MYLYVCMTQHIQFIQNYQNIRMLIFDDSERLRIMFNIFKILPILQYLLMTTTVWLCGKDKK